MSDALLAEGRACVADTMVLAMFVDAGWASLLSDLSGGRLYVPPSVVDPEETPPFPRQPVAEFAKGMFAAQRDLSKLIHVRRVERRTAFYQAAGEVWQPVRLAYSELVRARYFTSAAAARLDARRADSALKVTRISAGEAECAAVAVNRSWTLWSDDTAIVNVLAALHPGYPRRAYQPLAQASGTGRAASLSGGSASLQRRVQTFARPVDHPRAGMRERHARYPLGRPKMNDPDSICRF